MLTATADEVVEVLHNARALLDRPWGWTKGAFRKASRNGGTCYCAAGALERAAGRRFDPAYRGARNALSVALIGSGWDTSVVEFNDAPETKKKDVLALFDRAIDLVKKGG